MATKVQLNDYCKMSIYEKKTVCKCATQGEEIILHSEGLCIRADVKIYGSVEISKLFITAHDAIQFVSRWASNCKRIGDNMKKLETAEWTKFVKHFNK